MLEVVAALIEREGNILLCQRPEHKARGGLWEFVGGKVEAGESKAQALARECREELGVELDVLDEVIDVTHTYPDLTVHLTLLRARIAKGEPQKIEHRDIRWVKPEALENYELCPADREMVELLRANRAVFL